MDWYLKDGEWINSKDYNPDIHGTYFPAIINKEFPKFVAMVSYSKDGTSSKWWTTNKDGGLITCSKPDFIWVYK